jgi:hypothetical protein
MSPGAPGHGGGKNGKYGKYGGKNGGATGVTELDAPEDKESTTPLFNLTVKVYAVPLVSPVTDIGEVDEVPVIAPGFEVAI